MKILKLVLMLSIIALLFSSCGDDEEENADEKRSIIRLVNSRSFTTVEKLEYSSTMDGEYKLISPADMSLKTGEQHEMTVSFCGSSYYFRIYATSDLSSQGGYTEPKFQSLPCDRLLELKYL